MILVVGFVALCTIVFFAALLSEVPAKAWEVTGAVVGGAFIGLVMLGAMAVGCGLFYLIFGVLL